MYKIVNGLAASYLCDILQSINSLQTGYNLRREGNIRVPFARTESYKRSFFPHGIQLWNSTDVNLRNLPSITEFKLKFKPDISPSKTILYYGERWASIHHARLRLGCSKLNSHLCYYLHVIPSPECSCGAAVEDVAHFFFHCPNLNQQRLNLQHHLVPKGYFNLNIILNGDPTLTPNQNKIIFDAVHEFIKD